MRMGMLLGKEKGKKKRAVSVWCQLIIIHYIAHFSLHNHLQAKEIMNSYF